MTLNLIYICSTAIYSVLSSQVDEKVRSQMFKLRETWHDVFPATKLYQLDVKVNIIDPAWPIQAQPHQSNIHVNPNFLKKVILVNFVYNVALELIYCNLDMPSLFIY